MAQDAGVPTQAAPRQEIATLLSGVAEAAQKLLAIPDFNIAIDQALEAIAVAANAERIYIFENQCELAGGEALAYCSYEWCAPKTLKITEHPGLFPLSYADFDDWGQHLLAGLSVQATDREQPLQMTRLETRSTLWVPLVIDEGWWGVMGLDSCSIARVWSPAETAALGTAAACISGAIERDRRRKAQAENSQARFSELLQVNRVLKDSLSRLANEPDLNIFLGEVIDRINQAVGAVKGHVFLHCVETNNLELLLSVQAGRVHIGAMDSEPALFHHAFPVDITPAYLEMCDSNEIVLLSLIQETPAMWPGTLEWHRQCGHQEAAVVALRAGDRPIGLLGLCFCEPVTFTQEAQSLIYALADQAAVAINLARLAEDNRQQAVTQARETAERIALLERERVAQARAAELAKTNRAIAQTLKTLASKPQLSEFLSQLLLAIAQQLGAHRVHLFLYDAATHTLNLHTNIEAGRVQIGPSASDIELFHHPIPADISPAWRLTCESEDIIVNDLQSPLPEEIWWPGTKAWHSENGHVSWACVPMRAGDANLGLIGFAFRDRTVLTDEQLEFMRALSNQMIVAIQLTRLADEAQQTAVLQEQQKATQDRAAELARTNEAIAQGLSTLVATPKLDQFLGTIVSEMARQLNAGKVHLFLYDQESHTLNQRVVVQDGQVYLRAGPHDPDLLRQPIPADLSPGWDVIINTERPLTYDETQPFDEAVWWPGTVEWHKSQGHKAITCIPMKAGETPVGFIGFCFYNRTVLSDEQLEFMQALANQVIVSIQLTRLAEQARTNALNDERTRLAREIHDTLAQTFTGVSLQLEAVRGLTHQPVDAAEALAKAMPYVRRARNLARQGLSEARRSVRALRSEALETDALPDALQKALSQTQRDTDLATRFQLEGEPIPLADDIQLNLLRIAQEAITNTLRHANATELKISLSFDSASPGQPRQVQLCIRDDGRGFNPSTLLENPGFGIIGIRERVTRFYGTLELQSAPDSGTILKIVIPLPAST
ncbi:MAG: GAF domain-containing protein [Cyanobacteria bacterium P01_F01_bin.42]